MSVNIEIDIEIEIPLVNLKKGAVKKKVTSSKRPKNLIILINKNYSTYIYPT